MQKEKESGTSHIPWEDIKTEYLTTKISQRVLAEKYGVSASALMSRAQRQHWSKDLEQINQKCKQEVVEHCVESRIEAVDQATRTLKKLMAKIERSIEKTSDSDVKSIKMLTGAMRDLKEIGIYEVEDSGTKDVSISFENQEMNDYAD